MHELVRYLDKNSSNEMSQVNEVNEQTETMSKVTRGLKTIGRN